MFLGRVAAARQYRAACGGGGGGGRGNREGGGIESSMNGGRRVRMLAGGVTAREDWAGLQGRGSSAPGGLATRGTWRPLERDGHPPQAAPGGSRAEFVKDLACGVGKGARGSRLTRRLLQRRTYLSPPDLALLRPTIQEAGAAPWQGQVTPGPQHVTRQYHKMAFSIAKATLT